MKVRLKDFSEDWSRMFRTEVKFLKTIFGDEIIRCEHFGSTSVQGMKAKPVIDMMLRGNGALKVEGYIEKAVKTELIIFIFINLITLKLNGI